MTAARPGMMRKTTGLAAEEISIAVAGRDVPAARAAFAGAAGIELDHRHAGFLGLVARMKNSNSP